MNQPDLPAIREAAQALSQARAAKVALPPISTTYGISTAKDAYRVAEFNFQARRESGARIVGKKIGLTSKAVQQQLGVNAPDYGMLFDDMERLNGQDVDFSQLIAPKIEAEVAFVVGKDLTVAHPSYGQFLASLEYALPALEIVDSAIENWRISLVDTVADNASSALYVLGDQPVRVSDVALSEVGMQLCRNDELASVGTGAACLGHPLRAAYWLAQTMAQQGQGLKAGEVILSGALGPMVVLQRGDVIQATVGGIGNVSCRVI